MCGKNHDGLLQTRRINSEHSLSDEIFFATVLPDNLSAMEGEGLWFCATHHLGYRRFSKYIVYVPGWVLRVLLDKQYVLRTYDNKRPDKAFGWIR
jgi:hypothetical protein